MGLHVAKSPSQACCCLPCNAKHVSNTVPALHQQCSSKSLANGRICKVSHPYFYSLLCTITSKQNIYLDIAANTHACFWKTLYTLMDTRKQKGVWATTDLFHPTVQPLLRQGWEKQFRGSSTGWDLHCWRHSSMYRGSCSLPCWWSNRRGESKYSSSRALLCWGCSSRGHLHCRGGSSSRGWPCRGTHSRSGQPCRGSSSRWGLSCWGGSSRRGLLCWGISSRGTLPCKGGSSSGGLPCFGGDTRGPLPCWSDCGRQTALEHNLRCLVGGFLPDKRGNLG